MNHIKFQFLIYLIFCSLVLPGFSAPKPAEVFISNQRIYSLRKALQIGSEPTSKAWNKLKEKCDRGLKSKPSPMNKWFVPYVYDDKIGHHKAKLSLQNDANLAYEEALCYRITDEEKYAEQSLKIIRAWMNDLKEVSYEQDSKLSMSYHFPALIFAASLLEPYSAFTETEKTDFKHFLKEKILPSNTMMRENNHGNWGLVLVLAIASYTQDEELFRKGSDRWKYFIDKQISSDGFLEQEICRSDNKNWCDGARKGVNGLWYSHFTLMPQTLAAEIMLVNGIDLYDYISPNGGSLQKAYLALANWCSRKNRFPYFYTNAGVLNGAEYYSYFEILKNHWPDPKAQYLLLKARPMTSEHSAPDLTFTHGI